MQDFLVFLFVLLLAGSLLAWYLQTYRRSNSFRETPSYLKRNSLLLEHEQSYFKALSKAIGQHAYIFPKVRLSELLQPQGVQPEHKAHWFRVQRRCVDFLLCSPSSLTPVLAIDLDTRAKKRRREKAGGSDVLDVALTTANIPLLRVRAFKEYDHHIVNHQIRLALAQSQEPIADLFSDQSSAGSAYFDFQQFAEEKTTSFLGRWTSNLWGVLRRA